MILPLEITFRQMDPSPGLGARIRELALRLDRLSARIMSCHVIVEPRSHHARQGALYDFRIDITLPDEEIAIRRAHPADHAHEHPYVVALRDASLAARRRLEDYERRRRGDVKVHAGPAHGQICELDAEHGRGRIETDDGRLVYFTSQQRTRRAVSGSDDRYQGALCRGSRGSWSSGEHGARDRMSDAQRANS